MTDIKSERRIRQLSQAIRVNTPSSCGRAVAEVVVQPLVTERARLVAKLPAERRKWWKAVLRHQSLPASVRRPKCD